MLKRAKRPIKVRRWWLAFCVLVAIIGLVLASPSLAAITDPVRVEQGHVSGAAGKSADG